MSNLDIDSWLHKDEPKSKASKKKEITEENEIQETINRRPRERTLSVPLAEIPFDAIAGLYRNTKSNYKKQIKVQEEQAQISKDNGENITYAPWFNDLIAVRDFLLKYQKQDLKEVSK